MLVRPRYVGISGAFVGHDCGARSDVTRDQRGGMAIILCRHDRGNCADRALAGIALLAIARGNRRRESVLSNQHRLLGEDTRHRALRRCQGDRGQEGRGKVAGGIDAGHAGLAALVDLEDDAGRRIHRGEAQ